MKYRCPNCFEDFEVALASLPDRTGEPVAEPDDDDLVRRGDVFAVVQMMLEQFDSTENNDLRAGLHSMITDIPALATPPDAEQARLREEAETWRIQFVNTAQVRDTLQRDKERLRERVDAEAREIIDELRAYGEVASIPVYATQRARDFLQRTSAQSRLAQAERAPAVTEEE